MSSAKRLSHPVTYHILCLLELKRQAVAVIAFFLLQKTSHNIIVSWLDIYLCKKRHLGSRPGLPLLQSWLLRIPSATALRLSRAMLLNTTGKYMLSGLRTLKQRVGPKLPLIKLGWTEALSWQVKPGLEFTAYPPPPPGTIVLSTTQTTVQEPGERAPAALKWSPWGGGEG